MREVLAGHVTHYFSHLGVAAVELRISLHKGDRVHLMGHTTEMVMDLESMEVDHRQVEEAGPGDDLAVKVEDKVRH